ncbi:uncharacterized protein LOC113275853 isoform X2 [Papaver somniferum]|uniref:uncharacterized protein LOC113275853 isoform X2 n=1 Tax=Papaver somniferum TaxID=3469 RepID=UPI000E6F5216|nr:uncharacterized protein LOC113275853 isoform X2 [Papaver somniferum]
MGKPPTSKKQQKRGVDFKKFKRKIGRKLPPAKNDTNTNIQSKAIILPEQSVASERLGLALSKKGLTLKELLQQTSHHNAKVRKDAVVGIGDLTIKYPNELKVHRLAIIEKLRERISDEDKAVREALFLLLKTVIFPGSLEDASGPFISLIMAYIFNAMTHLAIDIRLMAFKFFDLVVQHYPSSFLSSAEKVLQNYGDILRKNHIFLEDKGKLKNALGGLVCCLSLLPFVNKENGSASDNCNNASGALHAFESEAPKKNTGFASLVTTLEDLLQILYNCFQELTSSVRVMSQIDVKSIDCMSCVLKCIDLAVKFFILGNSSSGTGFEVLVPSMSKGAEFVLGKFTMQMLLKKLLQIFPLDPIHQPSQKDDEIYYVWNVGIAEILMRISEAVDPLAILGGRFLLFIENALSAQICCSTRSSGSIWENNTVLLLPFIPRLVSRVQSDWKFRLLQAFTNTFKGCKPNSALNVACVNAIEELLLPSNRDTSALFADTSESEILDFQISWIQELPHLLVQLGDGHPSSSKVILLFLLRLGQCAPINPSLASGYDNLQKSLTEFYSTPQAEGAMHNGPFVKLPRDCQELAVSSLYYFSSLDPLLLRSLASCCLCNTLEPFVLFRIIEVLDSSHKAGHIQIADYISFCVTLLTRFTITPENSECAANNKKSTSHYQTVKAVTDVVCSCLSHIGDDATILQMLQRIMVSELSLNPLLDNKRAMLRLLVLLDSKPTILPEQSISNLANSLLQYLLDAASYIPEDNDDIDYDESNDKDQMRICQYYFVPCFFLFDRSGRLLSLVLNLMGSLIAEAKPLDPSHQCNEPVFDRANRISAITSILIFMRGDVKLRRALSSCKAEMTYVLQNLLSLQSSNELNMNLEERHRLQLSYDQLKSFTNT